MSKSKKLSRRMFLRGAGGATLAIPFLPSLLPRTAWGQSAPVVRRYFTFVSAYGYGHHQHWFPTLDQLPLQFNPGNGDHQFHYQRLSSYINNSSDELSYIFGNRLNPYLNKMNLIRGLNLHTRLAHARGPMLGNLQANDGHDTQARGVKPLPTIDQVLASTSSFTPHSNDPLTVGPGSSYSYEKDSSGNVNRASARRMGPHELFNQLFYPGGNPITEGGGSSPAPTRPGADILSRTVEDYRRISNGRKISSVDKQVLDNAMDRISDLQNRLQSMVVSGGCSYSSIDTSQAQNDGISFWNYSAFDHHYAFTLYAQIFAAAAACDLHRVLNFHLDNIDIYDRHPTEDFHQGHSHQPFATVNGIVNNQYIASIRRNYVQSFLAPLVAALDSSPDTNGQTILDNSLVHMTLENSTVHSDYNKPCLLIGGAGGNLTTGHYIDYTRRELGPHGGQGDNFSSNPNDPNFGHIYYGAHYNRAMTTILRAMGLSPSQYEDPEINQFFQNRSDSLIGAHNNGIARIGGYGHIGTATSGAYYYTNSELYSQQYARYNYHFYKDSLPFPTTSAS